MTFTAFTGRIYNPDLKFSQAGKAYFVCTVQEKHRDKNRESGQYENCGVTWHRVTYFGNKMFTAEALAEQATEGATAVVYGESKKKEYQKKDGTQGEAQEIIPDPGAFGVTAVAPEFAPDGRGTQGAQQSAPAGSWNTPQGPAGAPQGAQWGQQAPAPAWGNPNAAQGGPSPF